MRLFYYLKQNTKFYNTLVDQFREKGPTFERYSLPTKYICNLGSCFEVADLCVKANTSNGGSEFLVGQRQIPYNTEELTDREFSHLSQLSNVNHLKKAIKKMLIPRIVGTPGHAKVREYIIKSLKDLQWSIELDSFNDTAPIKGTLEFHNIIATLNPNAERYFVLACHYDSKYMPNIKFLGATDSAVPCAMLLNLAEVLNTHLESFRDSKLSLMLLFFDGEEAFEEWGPKDSIYGARHLAKKWQSQGFLPKIDILMLLDLLGAHSPTFYSYFQNTESWYVRLINIESRLADAGLMQQYVSSGMVPYNPNRYFQPNAIRSQFIEDDHTPFLKRHVPILHLIPQPFPNVWHTIDDNENIIDISTTENLARIIRLFTMEYLHGILNK